MVITVGVLGGTLQCQLIHDPVKTTSMHGLCMINNGFTRAEATAEKCP